MHAYALIEMFARNLCRGKGSAHISRPAPCLPWQTFGHVIRPWLQDVIEEYGVDVPRTWQYSSYAGIRGWHPAVGVTVSR